MLYVAIDDISNQLLNTQKDSLLLLAGG